MLFILQSKASSITHPAIQAATHDHAYCFFEDNSHIVIVQPSTFPFPAENNIISTATSGNTTTTRYRNGTSLTTSTFRIQETKNNPNHRYTTKRWLPIANEANPPPPSKKIKLWTDPYKKNY
jgi:hypothetical protein